MKILTLTIKFRSTSMHSEAYGGSLCSEMPNNIVNTEFT